MVTAAASEGNAFAVARLAELGDWIGRGYRRSVVGTDVVRGQPADELALAGEIPGAGQFWTYAYRR